MFELRRLSVQFVSKCAPMQAAKVTYMESANLILRTLDPWNPDRLME